MKREDLEIGDLVGELVDGALADAQLEAGDIQTIESGSAKTGATPINASGGLIGGGHPVGATGVRMALDAALQTRRRR